MFIPFFVDRRWKAEEPTRWISISSFDHHFPPAMGNQKRYGSQPDSINVIKVPLNSIFLSPLLSRFLIQTQWQTPHFELWPMRRSLRLFGGKTIVRNECGTREEIINGEWNKPNAGDKGIFGNTEDMSSKIGTPSKTLEEMRTYLNINKDYTPEGEADVRKENAWAFE
ncbi:hypothetical protein Bca4012_024834 [Brassica carinata]